ncbi:MAG: RsiW-degrading membrane proteinase PrsW (M82 family) [Saprospiraceae bacterium]|jgi:RsiW-degrading membrane proteinase PrsW (M82 family)
MKNFLLYIFPSFLIAAVLVNVLIGEPEFENSEEQIQHFTELEDHQNKRQVYFRLLQKDSLNVDLHFNFLLAHFQLNNNDLMWDSGEHRDDSRLFVKYKKYIGSDNQDQRDIGHFGLGIVFYFLQLYDECFFELQKIEKPDFKYLNYFLGSFYHHVDYEKSLSYYDQEIVNFPESEQVYQRKANLLMRFEKRQALNEFLQDSLAQEYVGYKEKRYAYFFSGQVQKYVTTIVSRVLHGSNLIGFVGAVCILIIWLVYLFLISSYKGKRLGFVAFTFLLGMLFAFGTSFLTDFNNHVLNFSINGEWKNDFSYAIIGIGAIEEAVKIIPFLLILLLNKNIKEPLDYIFYACVTALGFAFVENVIYFDSSGIRTIEGRALTATVTHLFNSSLIAYGLVIGKFSKKKNSVLYFLLFYVIASFSHGFYDFWLINSSVSKFSFITFLWLLMSMMIWASILNNCLNNSLKSQRHWKYNPHTINNFLLFSLSFIFLFQYVFVGVKFGSVVANYELQKDFISGFFLLMFLTISLSKFDYVPNYWAPLKFWDWDVFLNIPMVTPTYFDVKEVLSSQVRISSFGKHSQLGEVLPIEGKIVSRELISWEKDWYLIKLDEQVKIRRKQYAYLLVKTRHENELILSKNHQVVQVRLVSKPSDLEKRKKRKKEFQFIDLGRLEKLD